MIGLGEGIAEEISQLKRALVKIIYRELWAFFFMIYGIVLLMTGIYINLRHGTPFISGEPIVYLRDMLFNPLAHADLYILIVGFLTLFSSVFSIYYYHKKKKFILKMLSKLERRISKNLFL